MLSTSAHAIHYAIIAVGLGGLLALLAPRFLPGSGAPRDAHDARVRALRSALESPYDAGALLTAARVTYAAPVLSRAQRVVLPLVVVSSAASAGAHAAVGPAHFREATLFGLFFTTCALAQVLWAGVLALRPTRRLLLAGAVGNLAVLVLWATTRTVGLPFGLLPEPEVVGPWDLASGAWELLVVGGCAAMLARPLPGRLVEAWRWHLGVRTFATVSVLGLVALSLSGAAA